MNKSDFNLIEEQWIPVAQIGLVSLRDIFSNPDLPALGGSVLEKIAVMKLRLPHVRGGVSFFSFLREAFLLSSPRAWGCFRGQGARHA